MKRAYIFETVQYTQRTIVDVPDDWDKEKIIEEYSNGNLEVVDSDAMWEGCDTLGDYKVEF